MDQLQTESSRLFGPRQPADYLAEWLGTALRYPVLGMPTTETLQREQGLAGVPGEAELNRQVGEDVLGAATRGMGLYGLFRGGPALGQQLMGKERGAQTFGAPVIEDMERALAQARYLTTRQGVVDQMPPGTPSTRLHPSFPRGSGGYAPMGADPQEYPSLLERFPWLYQAPMRER